MGTSLRCRCRTPAPVARTLCDAPYLRSISGTVPAPWPLAASDTPSLLSTWDHAAGPWRAEEPLWPHLWLRDLEVPAQEQHRAQIPLSSVLAR